MDNGEVPMVRLGDASIASPFTAKSSSVMSSTGVLYRIWFMIPVVSDLFRSCAHHSARPVHSGDNSADVQDPCTQLPHICLQPEVRIVSAVLPRLCICLLALAQSVLYLDGIKMGDTQATIVGMMIALCFLFISHSKPLQQLSAKRPLPNIFSVCTSCNPSCVAHFS
jgi:cation-transporting ATPase 13A1